MVLLTKKYLEITKIPRSSGGTPRSNNGRALQFEKNISEFQYAVSMIFLSKKLLFSTLGSQIIIDFVWILKAGNPLIHLNFC